MGQERQGAHAAGSTGRRKRVARLEFLPRRPVFLISEAGPTEIAADQVSSSKIGRKALGLSALPSEWELPFFVVSADCFEQQIPHDTLNNWVSDCRTRIAMEPGAALMVRSSGTVETMRDRGSLISTLCKSGDVVAEVEQLRLRSRKITSTQNLALDCSEGSFRYAS